MKAVSPVHPLGAQHAVSFVSDVLTRPGLSKISH